MAPDRETLWKPGKLWSLWDMLRLHADTFVHVMSHMGQIRAGLDVMEQVGLKLDGQSEIMDGDLPEEMDRLEQELAELNLGLSLKALKIARREMSAKPLNVREIKHSILMLQGRIRDELETVHCLALTENEKRHYAPREPLLGPAVESKFVSTLFDVDEAGKCFAFGRYTACVFHLMRVVEAALNTVADKLGAAIEDGDGKGLAWGVVAGNMKDIIDNMPKGSAEKVKWYRVQSALVVVNRAWRVPTNHPKSVYTEEEARIALDGTRDC